MWRSTTWKLALVKYTDSTNIDTNGFEDIFDNWIQTYEKTFAAVEKNEQERETGSTPLTAPSFAATNLFNIFMEDSVRKQYTKQDTTILDKTYNHRALVVARNIYKFKNENGCVTYQKPICGDSGTLMMILETGGTLGSALERDILNFGNIQLRIRYNVDTQDFTLDFDGMQHKLDQFKSYMVHLKWNRSTFNKELCIYEYKHREDIPVYKVRPEMYWFDFENPICEEVGEYNQDFCMRAEMPCQIHAYPLQISNIKYYNRYMDSIEAAKESTKYTTQHESCVINDLARPISSGHGYTVR